MQSRGNVEDILHLLRSSREFVEQFYNIMKSAPGDVDWGSDSPFELEWAVLVNRARDYIKQNFPHSRDEEIIDVIRQFSSEQCASGS